MGTCGLRPYSRTGRIFRPGHWRQCATLSGTWQIQPPFAFRRGSGSDPSADSIRASTVTALAALPRLMPPGLETTRRIEIDDAGISDARAEVMVDAIRMCDGLGLGAVTLLTREQTVQIGTTVPIFIGAKLLTENLCYLDFRRFILDYMIAVMTHGGAGPFAFHLVVHNDMILPDAATDTVTDKVMHSFLRLMALDPRLDSGAGIGLIASAAVGVELLMGGLIVLTMPEGGSTGFDVTPWAWGATLAGAAWTAFNGWLGHRLNAKSATPPAITTDFTLTAWPDAFSPGTHILTRSSSSEYGRAMYTQVT